MKLIIEMPEKVVTAIQNGEDYRYDIHTAIAQGVPYEERAQGEWIHYLGCGVGKAVCSICGQLGETKKYCGNCGRRMRGEEE